jgi:hypothetical protein
VCPSSNDPMTGSSHWHAKTGDRAEFYPDRNALPRRIAQMAMDLLNFSSCLG